MQSELHPAAFNVHQGSAPSLNPDTARRSCHCTFAIYANIPVIDERGRYCSACGHYEFIETVRKQ